MYDFTDIDECLQATYEGEQLCSNNTYCMNIPGSFDCVCIPGYEEVDGVCTREYIKFCILYILIVSSLTA